MDCYHNYICNNQEGSTLSCCITKFLSKYSTYLNPYQDIYKASNRSLYYCQSGLLRVLFVAFLIEIMSRVQKLINGNSTITKNGRTGKDSPENGFHGGFDEKYTYESLLETAQYLLERIPEKPAVGIICGSGMGAYWNKGSLADALQQPITFPYDSIPNFPVSTVDGHAGTLVFGYLSNTPVICMQGRFHYYEGYPLWKCAMPVRVMKLIGVQYLIASNAAGGLNPKFKIGDIMLVKDHINIMGFAGNNPLQGPNEDRFGPRFPPMNKAYSLELFDAAKEIAIQSGWKDIIQEGVYTCLGGPNFETVAELKMLQMLGVDAVGMSTVHEVITARHCDLHVLAFSLITNVCVTDYDSHDKPNHESVMDVGIMRQSILKTFVERAVKLIAEKYLNGAI